MPSKYVLRNLVPNSYYHVFNQAVEQREIFIDDQDKRVFLFYVNIYTGDLDQVMSRYSDLPSRLKEKNLSQSLDLTAYCLMPTHFHLLIYQKEKDAMPRLLKQVINGYTSYFNHKHNRVGSLFAGRYRAAQVEDSGLNIANMGRYIHLNPVISGLVDEPSKWEWSSYRSYLGQTSSVTCEVDTIKKKLGSDENFVKFHADMADYKNSLEDIEKQTIDHK